MNCGEFLSRQDVRTLRRISYGAQLRYATAGELPALSAAVLPNCAIHFAKRLLLEYLLASC